MNDFLIVSLDDKIKIKYDRRKPLAGLQRRFIDKMDSDMDKGIKIAGELISEPNTKQRVQFVSNHLVNSILDDKDQTIAIACAYLNKAAPELTLIRISTITDDHSIELIFDD